MGDSVCEEAVYRQVYDLHAESLFRFAVYRTGERSSAEDLVQDAFTKRWQHCSKVSFEKAKSYLFTLVNNAFLNLAKREKVAIKYRQAQNSSPSSPSPHDEMEGQEFMDQLNNAINKLPEGQRQVFLLNRIDKFTYREIADLLQISQKAVEKRMSLALKTLRKLYKNI